MTKYIVGLDVEGVLVNPAADFAWLTYDNLLSERTKAIFPREVCEFYDSKYDDGRYLFKLNKKIEKKWRTGTWPLLSLALAAYDGIGDDELIKYANLIAQKNPGTDELLKHSIKKSEGKVYLITSSYPAVPLKIADEFGIPFKNVFSLGYTSPIEKEFYWEVRSRSPLDHFFDVDLEQFLYQYLYICERLGAAYEKRDKSQIQWLVKEHNKIFEKIKKPLLRKVCEDSFLNQSICMGSRRKVEALKSVAKREKIIYVGDGIVDAMPIKFADYGISMNMTNEHALLFSKLNVATTDVSDLIPIFDSIFEGRFNPKRLKKELDSDNVKIFTPEDIQQKTKEVIAINREMKAELKKLFKPANLT
jgi:predicted HAD superfamily phosphohydrolase